MKHIKLNMKEGLRLRKYSALLAILTTIILFLGCQKKVINWSSEDTTPPPISAAQMGVPFYPNAKMEMQYYLEGSSWLVRMTTSDSIDSVINFYKRKLGKPESDDNIPRVALWSKLIPNSFGCITVTVEADKENIGLVEILIIRAEGK
jgi:hypothetical protein